MNQQDKRISKILGTPNKIPYVSESNVMKYLEYLEENLDLPLIAKGIEPPVTGEYKIIDFNENCSDEEYGIIAIVESSHSMTSCEVPLCDLQIVNKNLRGYQLVDDYSYWYCNFR